MDVFKQMTPVVLAGGGELAKVVPHMQACSLQTTIRSCPARSLCLLCAGYMFTYYNSKVTKEREAQIDRINEQVRDLYGPLLACVTASKSAFDAMVRQHSPDGTKESFIQAVREDAEGKEAQAYRWASCATVPF